MIGIDKKTASQIAMNIEQVKKVFLAFLLTKPTNRVRITITQLIKQDISKIIDNNDMLRDVDQKINIKSDVIVYIGVIYISISKQTFTKGINMVFDIKNIDAILNTTNK